MNKCTKRGKDKKPRKINGDERREIQDERVEK
jgi:hypothetical protein